MILPYILDASSLSFTAHKPQILCMVQHMPHTSMTRGRCFVSKIFIYAKLHKLLCDVTGQH